ncbi:MAG TPA: TlyA family RNA methyltransferase [Acidobacteriaceae bacterium]|jgi:23S rRNA (cytidine1920-2'-O)/16S rRNA (cytidine1409-2'-O)-methyltransferase|nr:TlyA family RNA methyltransferase [Acidobacteriaceae bacterium]
MKSRPGKSRLDTLLTEQQLASSRSRAQERILAGEVSVNGTIVRKPGLLVDASAAITLTGEEIPYVSRGGLKLAAALTHWKINLADRLCLDVGASTGGFTDCMLQHGARQIITVDVGTNQLASRLRTDPRVQLLEQTNARALTAAMLPTGVSFFAVDVSFIAASLILPAVIAAVQSSNAAAAPSHGLDTVVLIKPQFEAGREHVGKGGIVRSAAARQLAMDRVQQTLLTCAAKNIQIIDSPIPGGDGNREFLLHADFC